MSYSLTRGVWEVRWRGGDGRQRSRRFGDDERAAQAFDEAIHDQKTKERKPAGYGESGGVYPYETAQGTRWRCRVKRSDGKWSQKRGFTSPSAAANWRRRQLERVERREVVHTKETFGEFFPRWLTRRKPYLEEGSWSCYERDGRIRLLPALESVPLGVMEVEHVRDLMDVMTEGTEAGEIAPKTVNNTLTTLVVCLNEAKKDKLMVTNPALEIPKLPDAHVEREYLRLHEIPLYLDSCSLVYRPLAELLIGSGLRISEAIALQLGDLELEDSGGVIVVYRSRKKGKVGSTKSDRFRAVEIGPGLSAVVREQVEKRAAMAGGDKLDALLYTMPVRVRKTDQGRWEGDGDGKPFDRTTVSRDWHKAALQDADQRDMPLHALRHTAAAAWLAGGNSLKYVQDQLGHGDIRTTERYYGHLERHVKKEGAKATEAAIARAVREHNGRRRSAYARQARAGTR
jgi:integrase